VTTMQATETPTPPPTEDVAALLVRFDDLLEAGSLNEALRVASAACFAAPDEAEPHYAYGQAWLALGEAAKSERAFKEAIRLAPRSPDAWVSYGVARYRQGKVVDAIHAMRQALRNAPEHKAALANLGAFLRLNGDQEGAEKVLREALDKSPDNVGARLNYVAELLQEEKSEEALTLLREGGAPADDQVAHRHWLLQVISLLLSLGRAKEAREEMAAFEALGPVPAAMASLYHVRKASLALRARAPAVALEAATQMEAALATSDRTADPEQQIVACMQLAQFWSRKRDKAKAFGFWTEGHRRMQAFQPFSREAHLAFVDANIRTFAEERFTAGTRAENDDPAPVFIVGMPRSGTTLCEQILGAHAQAFAAGERDALRTAFRALAGGIGAPAVERLAWRMEPGLNRAAARYLEALHALSPGSARIVDKMPGNTDVLALVGLMLPGAKIIHCVRDPRDIGLSIFTRRFLGHHAYSHDLGDLGWTIVQSLRIMDHWKRVLPNPILTLSMADWVHDFDGTLVRVLAHVDLPHDPGCADFHKSEAPVKTASKWQVREPINARGLGRWKGYVAALAPMIAELEAGGALEGWEAARS